MEELAGRTAVVTGAASGIGRALAGRFAKAGMNVALADVEEPALAVAYEELVDDGARTVGVTVLCPGFVRTRINESARNRPEELMPRGGRREPTLREEEVRAALNELTLAGRPPEEVADLVHDAILEGRFYVHTDETAIAFIRARHEAIQSASNPTPGELD